jgi:hypothetical protein
VTLFLSHYQQDEKVMQVMVLSTSPATQVDWISGEKTSTLCATDFVSTGVIMCTEKFMILMVLSHDAQLWLDSDDAFPRCVVGSGSRSRSSD